MGRALVGLVLALQTVGCVLRLTGDRGALVDVLSMDAPGSVPRVFLAALFTAAAVAAVAGAAVQQDRRTWWLAVAAVAAGIATVKAGGSLHADSLRRVSQLVGSSAAFALSALLAAGVVGALWLLSRRQRRDRRRVLGALCGYALAGVGLAALSSHAEAVFGGPWAAAATFVEESAEGLAGVAYLMAVLAGVAPQLVVARSRGLPREADAHVAGQVGGRQVQAPAHRSDRVADGLPTWPVRASGRRAVVP